MKNKFINLSFCFLSAIFLVHAFPKTDWWFLSWIGFIPLLMIIDGKNARQAFGWAYLCGFIFFLGTIYWLWHVTFIGMVVLCAYLALYFGLFGAGIAYFNNRPVLEKMFALANLWVVLEFLRAHLLSGFDWGSLGYSQYKNLLVIQIADITGQYGVSFLIVMVNVLGKEIAQTFFRRSSDFSRWIIPVLCAGILIVSTLIYGIIKFHQPALNTGRGLNVAVIQGNVEQALKWRRSEWPIIMDKHLALSAQSANQHPSLIIWPETSFPGYLWDDKPLFENLQDQVRQWQIPLLIGVVTHYGDVYYNSALLLSEQGKLIEEYNKVHLVPFGEYIPLRKFLPILGDLAPIGDFTSGSKDTVFNVGGIRFSVLICFEDTMAYLARRQVLAGSELLVNITNDAWFEDTKEPFMHLQSSVLRAVEMRRSVVRAANTGVSAFINSQGKILKTVQNVDGKSTYVEGFAVQNVFAENIMTFYVRFFNGFVYLCVLGLIGLGIKTRQEKII